MKIALRIVALAVAVLVAGCTSVNYGPLSVKSFGADVSFDQADWIKKAPDGSVEALSVKGGKRDASTSTHTAANLIMGLAGAVIGLQAGPAGSAGGAAAGLSTAELWQSLQDWLNKPASPAPTPAPVPAATNAPAPVVVIPPGSCTNWVAFDFGNVTWLGGKPLRVDAVEVPFARITRAWMTGTPDVGIFMNREFAPSASQRWWDPEDAHCYGPWAVAYEAKDGRWYGGYCDHYPIAMPSRSPAGAPWKSDTPFVAHPPTVGGKMITWVQNGDGTQRTPFAEVEWR